MTSSKPTLEFSSRTNAVIALRQKGLTTREIADRIGIEVKTVAALECSAARRSRPTGITMRATLDFIPLGTRQRLRPSAAARRISVDELMRRIIETVADDGLVDAILDDEASHA